MNNIPKTMCAAAIDRFGGPEVLTIQKLPVPSVYANEALITAYRRSWLSQTDQGIDGATAEPLACEDGLSSQTLMNHKGMQGPLHLIVASWGSG